MSYLSEKELDEIYAFAVKLGKDAGQLLLAATQKRMGDEGVTDAKEHVQKENSVDLVTETDEGMWPKMLALVLVLGYRVAK
jgi:myo-inositol-1(or 4)-monophosphatase